jgi:uncharacterized membrane protein YeaQ/YmgE (transglycosylase-associated protein family)
VVVDVIGWVVIGLFTGWFAKGLVGQSSYTGYGPQGDFGFGVLGALLGGTIARIIAVGGPASGNTFTWLSLIVAAIGSAIVLGLARATAKTAVR